MKFCPTCDERYENAESVCPKDGARLLMIADVADTDPLIGVTLDRRYKIDGKLGQGGMGAVYTATQAMVGRRVAVKVLQGGVAEDMQAVRRFMQEARAASALSHPNTITIHDFGQTPDGMLYLAMELVDGQPLSEVIAADGALPPERAARIAAQILNALQEAHGTGIVHRDLKPDNVLVTSHAGARDFLKVLDFGLAKVNGESSGLTQTGAVFGTPAYMSPEQAQGKPADLRADIYAVGCMLYEMLGGQRPFNAERPLAVLMMHMQQPPPAFETLSPPVDVPVPLQRVVFRAMEKDRARRYQSADEMLEAIDAALEEAGIVIALEETFAPSNPALSAPDLAAALAQAPGASSASLQPPTDSDFRGEVGSAGSGASRSKAPLWIGGALVLLGGAAAAVALTRTPEPPPPQPDPEPVVVAIEPPASEPPVVDARRAAEPPPDAATVAKPAADAAVAPVRDVPVRFESKPKVTRVQLTVRLPDGTETERQIRTPTTVDLQVGAEVKATFKRWGYHEAYASRTVSEGLVVGVELEKKTRGPKPAKKPAPAESSKGDAKPAAPAPLTPQEYCKRHSIEKCCERYARQFPDLCDLK